MRLIASVTSVALLMPVVALDASTHVLTGTWRSAAEELPLSSEFDESVWGKHATSVRTVDMQVTPAGGATLTVRRKVVDARGRTVTGSASVEEARLQLGEQAAAATPVALTTTRADLAVTVTAAERRYLDDPAARWPIDGLRVGVVRFTDDPSTIEIRVDTPEGRGSFWETLRRAGTRARPSTAPTTP